MAELVDALDLGSSDASRGGSSPSVRTRSFRRKGTSESAVVGRPSPKSARIEAREDMQVTETLADGLKRELKVVIGQGELGERFAARLGEVKDTVQLKGFRKGKVPTAHLKKLYGRSVMAEVLQTMIDETSRKAISERNERPAQQPNINLSEDKDEIERVLSGQSDLAFTMSYETLPKFAITDLSALKLEREVADVADEAINKALEDWSSGRSATRRRPDRSAGEGDRVTIDFVGRIDGQEFEGGKGRASSW